MRGWAKELRKALAHDASRSSRLEAARSATRIAAARAPGGAHHCHALTVQSRLSEDTPEQRIQTIDRAIRICSNAHGDSDIRVTRLLLDKARATFRAGRASAAYGISEPLENRLAAYGQDERLVALYALQAASLRAIQQSKRSFTARRHAGEWGAYALGRDHPDVLRMLGN